MITEYFKYILVAEKVKQMIEGNDLKGVLLVPLTKLGRDGLIRLWCRSGLSLEIAKTLLL